MKGIYCFIIFLCPFVSHEQTVKPLTVGNMAPDITIGNVYNYASSNISLSKLKGKLVVLDFMATTCVPCVRALPSFDSLQKQFGKRLQVILISPEEPARLQAFLKNHAPMVLPIAADTSAAKFFPHTYISHVVWIDPNGVVCAVTHPERVNGPDIQAVLQGQKINWPVKRDIPDYDFSKALFELNESHLPEEAQPVRSYYSSVVTYLPGVPKHSSIKEDTLHHATHFSFINYSRFELLKILFNRFQIPLSHLIIHGPLSDQLFYDPSYGYFETWKRENVYCLEATLPAGVEIGQQENKLLQDISFYFGMNACMEKRAVECLVLRNAATGTCRASVKKGLMLGSVVGTLNHQLNAMPVIDETHGKTDLVLPFTEDNVANNPYLRTTLAHYGIEVATELREIEFMIITKSDTSAN